MNRIMVIIPHFNRQGDLRRCLLSLREQICPHNVVVVDNGSSDGSKTMLAEEFPEVQMVCNETNLGFAGAINRGISAANKGDAEYFMLLNNDTICEPNLLEELLKFARQDRRRGIVAPNIYYLDAPGRLWSAGGEIELSRGWCRQLTHSSTEPRQVDYASGCALLVSREVVERVGLLDARFFMYFEEVDWCLRARQAGFEVWHVPQARLRHAVSATLGADSPAIAYYMARNRLLLVQKTRGFCAALHVIGREYLRDILVAALRKERTRGRCIRAATLDFFLRRFGEIKPPSLVNN